MLDDVGTERFAAWGASGGGPYALGCGALLPARVVAVGVVAAPAPFDEAADPDAFKEEREALAAGLGRAGLLAKWEAEVAPMRGWDVKTLLSEWGESFSPQNNRSVGDGETGEYMLMVPLSASRAYVHPQAAADEPAGRPASCTVIP